MMQNPLWWLLFMRALLLAELQSLHILRAAPLAWMREPSAVLERAAQVALIGWCFLAFGSWYFRF